MCCAFKYNRRSSLEPTALPEFTFSPICLGSDVGFRVCGEMSSETCVPSLGSGAESEIEPEEEETTSKPERLLNEGHRAPEIKRRKRKKDDVDMSTAISVWATSLKGPHLDLMVSLKQLAEVRLMTTGELSLSSCLTPASLRTIGIILEELIKDRMSMEFPLTNANLRKRQGSAQSQQSLDGSFSEAGLG